MPLALKISHNLHGPRMSCIDERDIVHETDQHWVLRVPTGFEVYRKEATHSQRCAIIGFKGQKGLDRAIEEIKRREATLH